MAFVLQKPVVFNASVYDNIAFGLRWHGLDRRRTRERVDDILDMVGMAAYRKRNARTLSGGEVQRVAIARALATNPEVLLLDEPTANLDPGSASRIEELVWDIIKRDAITVVMATHDMSQGQRLADKIGVLVNGEVVQTGGAREVFTSPRNREVAEFVGMENIIDAVVISNENGMVVIDIKGTPIEAVSDFPVGEPILVCIRPEDVTLTLEKACGTSARNCLAGTISWTVYDGPICRIEIDCGFPLVALVTRKSAEELELKKGKPVYANFKAVSIHIIKRH
jgi:tungstate transport system ATP-binding protein